MLIYIIYIADVSEFKFHGSKADVEDSFNKMRMQKSYFLKMQRWRLLCPYQGGRCGVYIKIVAVHLRHSQIDC